MGLTIMKINKTMLSLAVLMLTASAQPVLGMHNLQNNKFKYGAAIVAGITLGAGLIYYLTSKPTEPTTSEDKEESLILIEYKTKFVVPIWCSESDLNTLKKTNNCFFTNISEDELKICSLEENKCVILRSNPKILKLPATTFDLKNYNPYLYKPTEVILKDKFLKITLK